MTPIKLDSANSLIAQPDVAAGLINAIFADGNELVRPDELVNAPLTGAYESVKGLRRVERDVAKYFVRNGRCHCIFAFETQATIDPTMPIRVFSYDAVNYRDQLDNSELHERYMIGANCIVPVITTTLYFGEQPWRSSRKLTDALTISVEFADVIKPHIADREIKIIDFAGLSDEERKKYPKDIQIIAEYFSCVRRGVQYQPTLDGFVHAREVFYFLKYVVGNTDLSIDAVTREYEGVPKNMVDLFTQLQENGVEKGVKIGVEIGELNQKKRTAVDLYKDDGWSKEKIARLLRVDVADVRIWLAEAEEGTTR